MLAELYAIQPHVCYETGRAKLQEMARPFARRVELEPVPAHTTLVHGASASETTPSTNLATPTHDDSPT